MNSLWRWLRDAITETAARSIPFMILGAVGATAAGIVSYGFARFFAQQVPVSVALLTILSLFAVVGILAGGIPLWSFVSTKRKGASSFAINEDLEAATAALLRRLAEIEAGKQLWVDHEVTAYRADTLALFDAWEAQVQRYVSAQEQEWISELREEISGRSLHHSRAEAKDWTKRIKLLTDVARASVQ